MKQKQLPKGTVLQKGEFSNYALQTSNPQHGLFGRGTDKPNTKPNKLKSGKVRQNRSTKHRPSYVQGQSCQLNRHKDRMTELIKPISLNARDRTSKLNIVQHP